jgi:hypothetical protein
MFIVQVQKWKKELQLVEYSWVAKYNRIVFNVKLALYTCTCNFFLKFNFMQSVPIPTNVVISNPAQASCTQYNIM